MCIDVLRGVTDVHIGCHAENGSDPFLIELSQVIGSRFGAEIETTLAVLGLNDAIHAVVKVVPHPHGVELRGVKL